MSTPRRRPSARSRTIRPPRLRPGARIALVAPAGPVSDARIDRAVARCRELGLDPLLAAFARAREGYLAGSDADRAADLQHAIDDEDVDAVWALRGGYGVMRVLPRLDLGGLRRRPKPVIGFSDNTALHLALAREGVVSFHGPHAGAEAFPPAVRRWFHRVLFRPEPPGTLPLPADSPHTTLSGGTARGVLLGGNLALLASSCGTPHAAQCRGRILAIEDVGEPVYRIDRMLTQLRQSGAVDGVAAVAFGRFTDVKPCRHERSLETVLREWAEALGVPAVLGLPFGHIQANQTLPLGARAELDADAGVLRILDPVVT